VGYRSFVRPWRNAFAEDVSRRVRAASIYLAGQIKADISQPGTLRYHPLGKGGKPKKSQKTVYNFTHSRPGNPPYKQTGELRRSIGWELRALGLIGRVGSNIRTPAYPLYLELGTRRMAPRPYLRAALVKHQAALAAILTKSAAAGTLPPVRSNQFRSGHYGKGARAAGYF
jgi:hypothetical protein